MKEAIEKFLQEQGFVLHHDVYEKNIQVKTGVEIVNGVQHDHTEKTLVTVKYCGAGWESDKDASEPSKKPLTGWIISVNDFFVQYMVHDLEEFKQIFSGKF